MKKIILMSIFCLFAYAFTASAQTSIILDSAYGGQMTYTVSGRLVKPISDTVIVRAERSFNANFIPALSEVFDTITSAQDTVPISYTVDTVAAGGWYVRLYAINISDSDTAMSFGPLVNVTLVFVPPSISLGASDSIIDGGHQTYTYDAGNTTAFVKVFVSYGDTNFISPYLYDTLSVTGSGTLVFTFSSLPSQYYFSYKFVIDNGVGADTSKKRWLETGPSGGTPWISNVDSVHSDTSSISGWWSLVTNGTSCLDTCYIATGPTNAPFASIPQSFTGQGGITTVTATFTGLTHATTYYIWSCVSPGNCGNRLAVATQTVPIRFTFSFDTIYTFDAVTERFAARCTSIVDASGQLLIAAQNDPQFSAPLFGTALVAFNQGVTMQTIDVDQLYAGGFVSGTWYLAKFQGFNLSGDTASVVQPFLFDPQTTGIDHVVLDQFPMKATVMNDIGQTIFVGVVSSKQELLGYIPSQTILLVRWEKDGAHSAEKMIKE